MDKSGANKAAIDEINDGNETPIIVRQVKYLNFKSFRAAQCVLAGIELMHMIRKGQIMIAGCAEISFADQFYALTGQIRPV
jgi:transposase-like protein